MVHSIGKYNITSILTDELWKELCYIVSSADSGEQVLIDPGNNFEEIIKTIEANGNKKLKYILLTHGHHDHVGEVENIAKRYGVKALVHKDDAKLVRQSPLYAIRFDNRVIKTPREVEVMTTDRYEFNNGFVKVIHTPGHTGGSVCFSFDGFIFTGDTLLKELVGRTDLPSSKPGELAQSVDKLITELNADCMIFPGHGKPWKADEAKSWWNEQKSNPPQHKTFNEVK